MPADYQVVSNFVLRDRTKSGVEAVNRSVMGLQKNLDRMANRFTNAIGMIAGAAGIGAMVKGIISLNSEIQNTQIGIAGLITGFTKIPLEQSLRGSVGILNVLRKDAAAGIGELSDYLTGFQTLLPPMLSNGMKIKDILELNKLAIALGAGVTPENPRLGARLAARDVSQALYRGVNPNQTQYAMMALQSIGISNEQFNDMGMQDRIKFLFQGYRALANPMTAIFGGTFTAQMDTFKDNIKQMLRIGTGGLFKTWGEDLKKANEWIEKNRQLIYDIAFTVGDKLEKTYGYIKNHWRDIARFAIIASGTKIMLGMAPGIYNAASPAIGGMFARAKERNRIANIPISSYMYPGSGGGSRIGGSLLGGLGVGVSGGGALIGSGWAIAGILAAVGVGFMALYSAIKSVPNVLNPLYNGLWRVGKALSGLWTSVKSLTTGATGDVLSWLGQAIINFGATVLNITAVVIKAVSYLLDLGQKAANWGSKIPQRAGDWLSSKGAVGSFIKDAASRTFDNSPIGIGLNFLKKSGKGWDMMASSAVGDMPSSFSWKKWFEDSSSIDELQKLIDDAKKNGMGSSITNIDTVNVEVKAEINEDPNRIAAGFHEVLRNLERYKTQARI